MSSCIITNHFEYGNAFKINICSANETKIVSEVYLNHCCDTVNSW